MANALYKTNQDIPKDMLLGNLMFMNLNDMKIQDSDIRRIFKANSIPESYVRDISPADAFRRATSSIKNKTAWNPATPEEKYKVNVDEIRCDADSIKRIIGIKSLDAANEDVYYTPIAEVIFNRSFNQVVSTVTTSDQFLNKLATSLCTDIESKYSDWSLYHNKDTVRNIINRMVSDTHPVNLMPTGLCKFIPAASNDFLYNLKNALEEMDSYIIAAPNGASTGKNIVEIIPVIDTEEQRDLVKENFETEITDEMSQLVLDLKDVLVNKTTLSSRTAASFIDKFSILKDKATEYESLLNIYVDSIHTQIQEAMKLVDDNKETK